MNAVADGICATTVFFDGFATEPRLDHPEGLAVAADGAVWCGGETGQIYRIADGMIEQIATTGGFCLGMAFDLDGRLYICDLHHRAVFVLDPRTGSLDRFAEAAEGHRLLAPNGVLVDRRGDVFVSDSGQVHVKRPGLLRFNAAGEGELWLDEPLDFANGIALSPDGSVLYVVETWARRVLAIDVDDRGQACGRTVAVELPGTVPDGVAVDSTGRLWIACYEPSQVLIASPAGLEVGARDVDAHLLCHPTNIAFIGSRAIVTNLGRWHLSMLQAGVDGARLPPQPAG